MLQIYKLWVIIYLSLKEEIVYKHLSAQQCAFEFKCKRQEKIYLKRQLVFLVKTFMDSDGMWESPTYSWELQPCMWVDRIPKRIQMKTEKI